MIYPKNLSLCSFLFFLGRQKNDREKNQKTNQVLTKAKAGVFMKLIITGKDLSLQYVVIQTIKFFSKETNLEKINFDEALIKKINDLQKYVNEKYEWK